MLAGRVIELLFYRPCSVASKKIDDAPLVLLRVAAGGAGVFHLRSDPQGGAAAQGTGEKPVEGGLHGIAAGGDEERAGGWREAHRIEQGQRGSLAGEKLNGGKHQPGGLSPQA